MTRLLTILFLLVVTGAEAAVTYPLILSPGNHYLVDSTGAPFFINGDSPWYVGTRLTSTEVDSYFSTRAAQGYNSVIVSLVPRVVEWWAGVGQTTNIYGQNPFSSVSGGYTNLADQNVNYFTNVDHIFTSAANNGLCVFAYPLYAGYTGTEWYGQMVGIGTNAVYNYGQYIGNRYKNQPNIVWLGGGDYEMPNKAFADFLWQGIYDGGDRHLWSAQSERPHTARDYYSEAWDNVNSTYPGFETYVYSLLAYNVSPVYPSFMREAYYYNRTANGTNATARICRSEGWWSVLSGDAGHFYGDEFQWPFTNGWQGEMTAGPATHMPKIGALMSTLQWQTLIPDASHQLVTAGYGTYGSLTYAVAALAADGSLGVAYTPANQTMTVDLNKFAGAVTARWYDPTTGGFTAIGGSPFANSGTHNFSTPGVNAAGADDWVLLMEATSRPVYLRGTGLMRGAGTIRMASTGALPDTTPPILNTATIGANGTTWSMAFNEATINVGAGGSGGFSVTMSSAGVITLTYVSGSGTSTLTYSGSPTVNIGETVTAGLNYVQPGNGIEDTAGNDLASISGHAVVNNSVQGATFLLTENFEDGATGFDSGNANGWVNSGANPKYSPALADTQSLSCPQDSYCYAPFSASGEVWGYVLFQPKTASAQSTTLFQVRSAGGTELAGFYIDGDESYRLRAVISGGDSLRTTAGMATDGTTYRIWFHYAKGSGVNATADIEFEDTLTARQGNGTHFVQAGNGTTTTDAARLYLQNNRLPSTQVNLYDTVRMSATGYYIP